MGKKMLILAAFLLALTVATPALAYYPSEGDLVKTYSNASVYYVDGNNRRHLFPNEATFFSWYSGSWKDQNVITISQSELGQIDLGKNVTVRPGYALVRFGSSLKMYAVLPGEKLCRAPSHYGNYQYNRALVISAGFEADYYNDGICDITYDQKLPDGTLLRYKNSWDIYYIQNGQKRLVTATGFKENNFRYESVIMDVDASMSYPDGSSITSREDGLTKIASNLSYYYTCSNNWSCSAWSSCTNGYRYRSCWDKNYCSVQQSKPVEKENCYTCTENWSCNSWSNCVYNKQYRSCWDNNACGTTASKPVETRTCTSCVENWSCGGWGTCQGSGTTGWQYRTCTDLNYCGTYSYRPNTSQTCKLCTENWSCTNWSVCSGGQKYRDCIDTNRCGTITGRPTLSQSCY